MTRHQPIHHVTAKLYVVLVVSFLICLPGVISVLFEVSPPSYIAAILYGIAIFGAALILGWAAEAAQIDISESLAVAILALFAVLPEYAVDFVFTWKSASDPSQAHLAIANMTGANRLLVGLGWPAILLLFYLSRKKAKIILHKSLSTEIFYLAMASIYSLTIPLKGSLNLIDTAILVSLFVLYARRAAQLETPEPEFVGPVKIVANLATFPRRLFTIFLFVYAGVTIFLVAEPFTEALKETGTHFGINQFFLVQWLAPLASEAPEFIVASTWAMRGHAGSALRVLISSKVNQWTLLVATLPLVFAIAGGEIKPFLLDSLQRHELYLTGAQSIFAVALIAALRLGKFGSILLVTLFAIQLVVSEIRMEVAAIYIGLAVLYHILNRKNLLPIARTALGIGDSKK